VLYQATSLGFVRETFDAWVTGITNAIVMAHRQLQKGKVYVAQGDLYGANINLNAEGEVVSVVDARAALEMYETYCDALGLDCSKLIVQGR
jgi:hypothetical protein